MAASFFFILASEITTNFHFFLLGRRSAYQFRIEDDRPWHLCYRGNPSLWSNSTVASAACQNSSRNFKWTRARICKRFKKARNRFQGIESASLCSMYGKYCRVVVPVRQAGNQFLGSLKGVQIRAQVIIWHLGSV